MNVDVRIKDPATLIFTNVRDYVLQGIQLNFGRQDFTSSVSSNRASIRFVYDSSIGSIDPTTFGLGNEIRVDNVAQGFGLFGGLITDVSFDKDTLQVTAVSDGFSRLGRGTIDSITTFGGEFDDVFTDLYNNYLNDLWGAAGGPGVIVGQLGPVPELVTVPTLTNASGITVLQTVAASAPNGFLFEGPGGQLYFKDANYFRPSTWPVPPFTITGDEIVNDWQMTKTIGTKVNRAQVDYASGTATAEDAADIASFGVYETSLATYATDLTNAQNIADRQVANLTNPGWQISAITIPLAPLSTVRQLQYINQTVIGTVVDIPELYTGLPTRYVVQGITDSIGRDFWERTFYLADWELFRPAQWWSDVPAAVEWDDVDPALTWDEMITEWIS